MKIEMNKEYQTRDGREVRIYAVDVGDSNATHGAIKNNTEQDLWDLCTWTKNGFYYYPEEESAVDLIEKPEVIEGWVNVYSSTESLSMGCIIHKTKEDAGQHTGRSKVACIPIKFLKGEGLDNE